MGFYRLLIFALISLITMAFSSQDVDPRHVLFLMSSKQFNKAVSVYESYYRVTKQHDFTVLEQMGRLLIEEGCNSSDLETALIGLYGLEISGLTSSESLIAKGVSHPHPQVQLIALHLLSKMYSDGIDEIIARGMMSQYLPIRVETLVQLTTRKSKLALGHVKSLMHILPHEFRIFFPEFFASIGTFEATKELKLLISDRDLEVRISAILATAKHFRDDLLPDIRSALSHQNPAELEAAAIAVGLLRDLHSIDRLTALSSSPFESVKLAALLSRYILGDQAAAEGIKGLAQSKNPFAIQALSHIPLSCDLLATLAKSEDSVVALNSLMSLLSHQDPRGKDLLKKVLIKTPEDLGMIPLFSLGRGFTAWKLIPSTNEQAKIRRMDLQSMTIYMKEEMLKQAMELPREEFLDLARDLFDHKEYSLIPLLVKLLENIKTEESIVLLKENANRIGDPFIRSYALLSLYRMGVSKEYTEKFLTWIDLQKGNELFRFRPIPEGKLEIEVESKYHLTPEENSALLLESFQALATKHEISSIDVILSAIKNGNPKNRPALGGMLLLAIR